MIHRTAIALATCLLMLAPTALAQEQVELSILQWSHFVPEHDPWFDAWAADWGAQHGARVRVDHINFQQIPQALAGAIDAGEGHSLIQLLTPGAAWVEGLHPLNDVNAAAAATFGERVSTCARASYLPAVDTWFSFALGYLPGPGNYQQGLWAAAGLPQGPTTWQELYETGRTIYAEAGVPLGLGLSPEVDSQAAVYSALWSFGGSVQDEDEQVVLNSPETVAAVRFLAQMQREAMSAEVFGWTPASNNQALIAGEVSYIINPVSAYRSLQKIDPEAAADIHFTPALAGPGGAYAGTNGVLAYVIPRYVEGRELELARKFLLDHAGDYGDAVWHSELYSFPCYPATAPQLDAWLDSDPFGSQPADKLAVLKGAGEWTAYVGHPGPANPAVAQFFAENHLVNMVARVALGEVTAEQAVAEAHARAEAIFDAWRAKGLVGSGAGQ